MADDEKPAYDPYAILEVARDATEEDIKAAYRKLSKTCHPDSPEVSSLSDDLKGAAILRFAKLVKAKDDLLNPEMRAAIDSGVSVDLQLLRSKARSMISQMVAEIISNSGFKASYNILTAVQSKLRHKIAEAEKANTTSIQPNIPRLEAIAKSICKKASASDNDNIFVDIIESNIRNLKAGLKNNNDVIAYANTALSMLEDYDFSEPPEGTTQSFSQFALGYTPTRTISTTRF